MAIELPRPTDVDGSIAVWRANDPRLGALLERYGDAPRALRHYGLILWEQGQPKEAVSVLTGALALVPDDYRYWADLAGALSAADQLSDAAACMEESLFRNKAQADGWLRLGSIRSGLGDPAAAESALQTALALDPGLRDAQLSLALVYFHTKRFEEAAVHLRKVLQADAQTGAQTDVAVQACYGQALAHVGQFAGAAEALQSAIASDPTNETIALKGAQARFIADLLAGDGIDAATAACRARPFVTAAAFQKISRHAFHLLSAFGHAEPAIRLGEARLVQAPDDPEQRYLLAIAKGEALQRAPDRYVTSFFDQFAGEFDKQLVGVLGYDANERLVGLVDESGIAIPRILDLGCGTGLAGPLLSRPGRHLVGVDLSQGMLEKARARGCYAALIKAEAVDYLAGCDSPFDLVFAADVLIYVGDLTALMPRVARALAPGGLFAFTIETSDAADLVLLPSGRFAHRLDHVVALGQAAGMRLHITRPIAIRYETEGFVAGELVILQRP